MGVTMNGLKINSVEQLIQGIGALPGEILLVSIGDTVRVRAAIEYRGPALSDIFYVAIGNRIVFFDEIWVGSVPISFPQSTDWQAYELTADVLISEIGLAPWTPGRFDLYVKLVNNPGIGMPELSNVIEVMLRAEFRDFRITGYDLG
ncbi:hypothetical protein ES703_121898 [subsurface metagenome]